MRALGWWRAGLLGLAVAWIGGCAGAAPRGPCKDYRPLGACSLDFEYVCETTEDGCEQCSCVPRRGVEDGRFGPQLE